MPLLPEAEVNGRQRGEPRDSAFQAAFGGEHYGVTAKERSDGGDYPVYHALTKLHGKFYDYCSVFRLVNHPTLSIRRATDADVTWFDDEFLDDRQWADLHRILADVATGRR